ncbi:MAG: Helix-turn-helix domain [Actinomycetia bacterium]|nr:Helix-turn-helix domain [Actinomycetes bacterium]
MAERVLVAIDEEVLDRLLVALDRSSDVVEQATRRFDSESKPGALTIKETAFELGVSVSTVERMTRAGELNPVRFGNRVRYPRHEIDRVLGATIASPVRRVG